MSNFGCKFKPHIQDNQYTASSDVKLWNTIVMNKYLKFPEDVLVPNVILRLIQIVKGLYDK